jgi:ferredoxin
MKKLCVNEEACIGCGACVAIDSEHFDFNDNGLSHVINNENIESDEVKNAISSCPTNAIGYVEEDSKCNCDDCQCGDNCQCGDECSCHK